MEFRAITFENTPSWDSIEFSNERIQLNVYPIDDDSEVQLELDNGDKVMNVYLTQNNIKQLIDYLQKQIK